MTSIHCTNTVNYQYNDLEKQLPEYCVPSNIGEHFYITIFNENDMVADITNMTEDDTEDDTADNNSDDSDIENAKVNVKEKRKPNIVSKTANTIVSGFVTKFLNMINQVREEMKIMPYSM
jgi:hypothetical protein